jgi:hypothetical protein
MDVCQNTGPLVGMCVVYRGLGTSYKVKGRGSNLYFITIMKDFWQGSNTKGQVYTCIIHGCVAMDVWLRMKHFICICVVQRGSGTLYKVSGRGSIIYFITINVIFEGLTTWFEPQKPSLHIFHTWLCRYGCVLENETTNRYVCGS